MGKTPETYRVTNHLKTSAAVSVKAGTMGEKNKRLQVSGPEASRQQSKTAWQGETRITMVHVKRRKPDLRETKNSNGTKLFLLCLELRRESKI